MRRDVLGVLLADTVGSALITGCGTASSGTARSSAPQQTQESTPASDEAGISTADVADLTGHTLMIYCGAGMTKPFQEIADSFKLTTGYEMSVTYAGAGQIQSQIITSEKGDIFIIGSAEELKPVRSYVSESRALVKHTPVLAVQNGNSKSITSLSGLAAKGVSLIIGDTDSTPIGKIAREALSDVGILDEVQTAASTTTAPQMTAAIAAGEADATIIWRENCDAEGVEIMDNSDLEDYIKTIPAASLIYSTDHDARQTLLDYLNSGGTREIWIMYGYEIAE